MPFTRASPAHTQAEQQRACGSFQITEFEFIVKFILYFCAVEPRLSRLKLEAESRRMGGLQLTFAHRASGWSTPAATTVELRKLGLLERRGNKPRHPHAFISLPRDMHAPPPLQRGLLTDESGGTEEKED